VHYATRRPILTRVTQNGATLALQRHALLTAGSVSATAAAARRPDRRLFSAVPASARRRRPAIDRRPVLNKPHIRTQRVAGEVLSAPVAPELAGAKRRISAHCQQRLVSRIGLRPPGNRDRSLLPWITMSMQKRARNLVRVDDAIERLEHHDDEHVVVESVLTAARHASPDRGGLSRARAATAKRRETRVHRHRARSPLMSTNPRLTISSGSDR